MNIGDKNNIISIEIKTPNGISVFTLGRTPNQNAWVTNWYGIVDSIKLSGKKVVSIEILFTDGRAINMNAFENQLMIVTAKDEVDLIEFKDSQMKIGIEEMENLQSEDDESNDEKRKKIMPVNL